jgi:hypothetical protein
MAASGGASRKILWDQSAYVGSECILRQDLYTNMYILKGFSKKAVGSADPTANTQLRRCCCRGINRRVCGVVSRRRYSIQVI